MRIEDESGVTLTTATFQLNGDLTLMIGVSAGFAKGSQVYVLKKEDAIKLKAELEEFINDQS